MWRPKDWRAVHTMCPDCGSECATIYEDGADAMLDRLRRKGEHISKKEGARLALPISEGTYVFIPDEEKDA